MDKDTWIFVGIGVAGAVGLVCLNQYNTDKERKLRRDKIENERLYFEKLSPEQVELIETQKIDLKTKEIELEKEEIELRKTEAELKKTVTKFKEEIENEIRSETKKSIDGDMRNTFDNWAAKFEIRIENKVDNVVSRIDSLSDKYGGVKQQAAAAPSINVVNAPNN